MADLSQAFVLLTEAAAAGNRSPDIWGGHNGYHFTENGTHVWAELAKAISAQAQDKGYITKSKEIQLPRDEATTVAGFESVSWGLNSLGKAERLGKYLGWKPAQRSLEDEIPEIVEAEHKRIAKA